MKPQSAIQKGKELENYVCDQLRLKGLDDKAYRSHGSGNGNKEKADIWTKTTILGRNAGIECKNHATPHIKDWWEQTQKLEVLGREPVLVYKLFGESMEEAKAVIYLDTLLDLIKNQTTAEIRGEMIVEDSWDKTSAINKIIYAMECLRQAKRLLKKDD